MLPTAMCIVRGPQTEVQGRWRVRGDFESVGHLLVEELLGCVNIHEPRMMCAHSLKLHLETQAVQASTGPSDQYSQPEGLHHVQSKFRGSLLDLLFRDFSLNKSQWTVVKSAEMKQLV